MEIKSVERSEVLNKYKWNLSLIYKNNTLWLKDYNVLNEEMYKILNFKGNIIKSSDNLLGALEKLCDLSRLYEKLYLYAMCKNDEDTRDVDNTKLKNMITTLGAEFSEITSFFEPELMQLTEEKITIFLKENSKLKVYNHYLRDILRFKDHTLSLEEEKIIASASETLSFPSRTFSKLANADMVFGNIKDEYSNVVEITNGNYSKYISSPNRLVRKRTFNILYKGYEKLKNTFAELLIGDIKANYFVSKNKKFSSPLEMALFYNNIDDIVYNNVITTINNNLDKLHKYVKLKKKVLKLRELHMYDFYVDLIKEYDIEYTYEEAVELILKALKPLGRDYVLNAQKMFDKRLIDVYENKGKKAGAHSTSAYDTQPFILLNYNGKLDSVSTVAHELGHSMHSSYSSLKQPFIYHDYSIFVAEIASNVNEMLLNMYLLDKTKDDQQKLSLINNFLESVKGSIYRQTMFAEFEKTIYELEGNKQPLTEETISSLYYGLNKKYYGKDIIHDEEIRYEWMRVPHFYFHFYVYQYATGLTAAFFIAKDIYEGNEEMRKKYIEFLSSGSSDYALNLLKKLGIDMTSPEPLNRILEYFDQQMDEFIRIINKK